MSFDTIIRNGRWFDGTGAPSAVRDIGIADGRVTAVAVGGQLEAGTGTRVIDATGKWVLPGMVDIHTHYDVEVLNGPGLPESVRHGVTTVLMGNCGVTFAPVKPADRVFLAEMMESVEDVPRLRTSQ